MPHDVIMPALGMAQDTGLLVAWHKNEGDAVATGDVLFEVETDKSTMEVEAQADGFLSGVKHSAGADVPVGEVIAQITETQQATTEAAPVASKNDTVPQGQSIIMPALGMAQDTGLIVAWHKQPGDAVAASDILFEVETDKSTMEVEAGHDGFLAAVFYQAGSEAPVGVDIAVISAEKPETLVSIDKSASEPAPTPATVAIASNKPPAETKLPSVRQQIAPLPSGKILASPKLRRLALERGLDLTVLLKAGHPQPYHVADLSILEELSKPQQSSQQTSAKTNRLVARVDLTNFVAYLDDTNAGSSENTLADFALHSAPEDYQTASVSNLLNMHVFDRDGSEIDTDTESDLSILDLRHTPLLHIDVSAASSPMLAVLSIDKTTTEVVLEYTDHQMDTAAALRLITDFSQTLEQPLRRLL